MDSIGRHRALHTLKASLFDENGRHRALHTLKGSFLIKMDGIGPYILLRILSFRNIDGIGP